MPGDNFHFDMTAVLLDLALKVAFGERTKAVAWAELDVAKSPNASNSFSNTSVDVTKKIMVLYWSVREHTNALPGKMSASEVEPFVRAWLRDAEYGKRTARLVGI